MKTRCLRLSLAPLLVTAVLATGGCSAPSQDEAAAPVAADATAVAPADAAPAQAAVAPASTDALVACGEGDARSGVFLYRATADAEGVVREMPPPVDDGDVVRVEVRAAAGSAACTGNGPHRFTWTDPDSPTPAGMYAVIAGAAGADCTFSGYYQSETRWGDDENWGETHYTPQDAAQIVASGKYCAAD
ncbi:hypothetical protein LJR143_002138 [Pseudoxanthomonas sp. LjRoot143]|uniref:hypothetical protein n=1 Tax=Pseudoxanthomonas sp. LjRoot143 TaxID=3342266 RepID=UPI003ECF25F6